MPPKNSKTFKFFYTQLVMEWLEKHEYSRKHWMYVAEQSLNQSKSDPSVTAVSRLESALKGFHHKYRKAVVKDFNLLSDILEHAFDHVDWKAVAEFKLQNLNRDDKQ
jgi:hypothetical protein